MARNPLNAGTIRNSSGAERINVLRLTLLHTNQPFCYTTSWQMRSSTTTRNLKKTSNNSNELMKYHYKYYTLAKLKIFVIRSS